MTRVPVSDIPVWSTFRFGDAEWTVAPHPFRRTGLVKATCVSDGRAELFHRSMEVEPVMPTGGAP